MIIPYKCKSKKDIDIIFNQHDNLMDDNIKHHLYKIKHSGSVNIFIDTDSTVYSYCAGNCDSCMAKCGTVNIEFINPTNEFRKKKLERICND